MYDGDPDNKKAGLKEISFYDPSGGNGNAQEIEKKLVSSLDEVFHPMVFYEWDEVIDKNQGSATRRMSTLYGHCTLCGNELSLTLPEGKMNESAPIYPLGVQEYEALHAGSELQGCTVASLAVKTKTYERVSHLQDTAGFGHLTGSDHKFKLQYTEELNACAGRPRLGLSARHWRKGGKIGRNRIYLNGKRHYFDRHVVVPYPCEEAIRDFVGADYGAMALQAMHWVAANRVLVDVGGYFIQLVLGDVMSASCVLINWDVQSHGFGKYDSESTMVVDVALASYV